MLNRSTEVLLICIMSGLSSIAFHFLITFPPAQGQSSAMQSPQDNQELERLCEEDQSDRTPPKGKSIDLDPIDGGVTDELRRVMIGHSLAEIKAREAEMNRKEKSCGEHPQLIGSCFTLRGRLSIYNGTPALRLWRVGTRRVLGISEQRFSVAGYRNVPEYIESQTNQNVAIFGDFLVCPFTRSRPGEMQLVCIEAGKNLLVHKQK